MDSRNRNEIIAAIILGIAIIAMIYAGFEADLKSDPVQIEESAP